MIMIKWSYYGTDRENVAYSLNEKGISLTYKGKIKRTYRWERMKTKRIVYKGRGFMGQRIAAGWEDRNECAVFVLEKLKILYGSRHSHQKHGVKNIAVQFSCFWLTIYNLDMAHRISGI